MSKFKVWIDTPDDTNCLSVTDFENSVQREDGFKAGQLASSIQTNSAIRQANLISVALMEALGVADSFDLRSAVSSLSDEITSILITPTTNIVSNVTKIANSTKGFAAGYLASSTSGAAIGNNAKTTLGVAVGDNAKCEADGSAIDAVQLGTGTNSSAKSVKAYNYELLSNTGQIPSDRLSSALSDYVKTTQSITNDKIIYGQTITNWTYSQATYVGCYISTSVFFTSNRQCVFIGCTGNINVAFSDSDTGKVVISSSPNLTVTYASNSEITSWDKVFVDGKATYNVYSNSTRGTSPIDIVSDALTKSLFDKSDNIQIEALFHDDTQTGAYRSHTINVNSNIVEPVSSSRLYLGESFYFQPWNEDSRCYVVVDRLSEFEVRAGTSDGRITSRIRKITTTKNLV